MPREPVETLAHVVDVVSGEARRQVDHVFDRLRAAGIEVSGEAIHLCLGEAERLPDVLEDRLGPVCDHVRHHGSPLTPVPAEAVLDHLLATLCFEIDVDIGWLPSLVGQEAFERETKPDRVHTSQVDAARNSRVRTRPTDLTVDVA